MTIEVAVIVPLQHTGTSLRGEPCGRWFEVECEASRGFSYGNFYNLECPHCHGSVGKLLLSQPIGPTVKIDPPKDSRQ